MRKILIYLLICISLISCKKKEIYSNNTPQEISVIEEEIIELDMVFKSKVINEFNTSSNDGFDYYSTANFLYSIESELRFENFDKIKNVKIYEFNYENEKFYLSYDKEYDNRIPTKKYYRESGFSEYNYEFDEEGRILKFENLRYYEYPDTGILDCYQQNFFSNGKLQKELIFQKTDFGYIKKEYSPGIKLSTEKRFYLENGKLIKMEYYSENELGRLITLKYDDEGRIIYVMEKSGIKYPPIEIVEKRVEYLDQGIVEIKWYSESNTNVKMVQKDFDQYNNWRYAETFFDGRSYHKYIREFEYAE